MEITLEKIDIIRSAPALRTRRPRKPWSSAVATW